MMTNKFQVGDRVELVKPFTCEGDDEETMEDIRERLDQIYGSARIFGTVTEVCDEYYYVQYESPDDDKYYPEHLYTDEDCLEFEKQITDEDVADAIRSIMSVSEHSSPDPGATDFG